jgi:hypothetical protein
VTKRKSPEKLRFEAKKLMKRAEREEQKRYREMGRVIVDHIDNNFNNFDLSTFKEKVIRIWTQ